ncbi:MAG: hypothetical protein HON90_00520, partial [Halobacteriovoraceae bacterium]|nr:hypothetical protein [Halobacteriovoraceae bacterium]
SSQKTQLGDSIGFGMSIRYQKDEHSFSTFRFETDPAENRKDNETSTFEIIYNRSFQAFTFQVDLDLQTNDSNSGGTNLGIDLDSDDSYISFAGEKNYEITFYPLNFRTDIGDEFNTRDVTRISYIEGSPTSITAVPTNDEQVVRKTIPGLEFKYKMPDSYAYFGLGIGAYLYPTNSDYDITENPTATSWERKEVTAYKLGYLYNVKRDSRITVQFAAHDKTQETGALLESAASVGYFKRESNFLVELEYTHTKAGEAPYNISRTSNWFENVAFDKKVYSDENGDVQDWVGKTGSAYSFKLGYNFDKITPYISLKHQDEHFIYNAFESAHVLRVDDKTQSHGGLNRLGVGSYFYYGRLFFNPQLEWQKARNAVFSNSTGVTNDRMQSSFTKENLVLSMNMTFVFDGSNLDQNWWF